MKKALLFFTAALLINTVMGQNKIQDTFWGCILGKSTYNQEVSQAMQCLDPMPKISQSKR